MEPGRIPNRLRYHRNITGYSQKRVARLIGLRDTSMLSRWERGISIPSMLTVFRLAQLYHALPHELYSHYWKGLLSESQESETPKSGIG